MEFFVYYMKKWKENLKNLSKHALLLRTSEYVIMFLVIKNWNFQTQDLWFKWLRNIGMVPWAIESIPSSSLPSWVVLFKHVLTLFLRIKHKIEPITTIDTMDPTIIVYLDWLGRMGISGDQHIDFRQVSPSIMGTFVQFCTKHGKLGQSGYSRHNSSGLRTIHTLRNLIFRIFGPRARSLLMNIVSWKFEATQTWGRRNMLRLLKTASGS